MGKSVDKGWVVKSGNAASPTTNLKNVRRVRPIIGERGMIDSTDHDTTDVKTALPAPLRERGGVEIVVAWDPADATHEDVRAAHAAGTKWYFTPISPAGGAPQWAYSGYIRGFALGEADAENPKLSEVSIIFDADGAEAYTQ